MFMTEALACTRFHAQTLMRIYREFVSIVNEEGGNWPEFFRIFILGAKQLFGPTVLNSGLEVRRKSSGLGAEADGHCL